MVILHGKTASSQLELEPVKLKALYESLSPRSMSDQAAFAELFPQHALGQQASHRVWQLLAGAGAEDPPPVWPEMQVQRLVNRFVFPSAEAPPVLEQDHQLVLERLSHPLANRQLMGASVCSEDEVCSLEPEQIDLARALLLAQGLPLEQIEAYERCLDLMALQVMAALPPNPTELDKLQALSHFIFVEQRFRFPPKARMSLEIDQWTMLSQVLDSRRGVCLGVSQLYLCLAQRINLPLEIVTPPGHIYVRWASEGLHWNIETTAHGIHLPTHHYLGLTTKALRPRDMREVVGMSLYNAAAVPLHTGRFDDAIRLYRKAERYLKDDYDLQHALGMALFCAGQVKEAQRVLKPLRGRTQPEQVVSSHLIDELLDGDVSSEALANSLKIIEPVRSQLLAQEQRLIKVLERCPRFFHGYQDLAHVYLQLNRPQEALEVCERSYLLGARAPYLLYLLCELSLSRYDLPSAARYFRDLEQTLLAANHAPSLLHELRLRLSGAGAPIS